MSPSSKPSRPSDAEVVRVLRDGFWDRTEVIRLDDGGFRVRKASKGDAAAGPWGVESLRREIRYLSTLSEEAAACYPRLQAAWDDGCTLGYEMTYVEDAVDAGEIAQQSAATQAQADIFQDKLGEIVFGLIHEPAPTEERLSVHMRKVMEGALIELGRRREFAALFDAADTSINGEQMAGTCGALSLLLDDGRVFRRLDQEPCIRLHGDLFLENILLPRRRDDPAWPTRITLVDPVSVAGVVNGHPLFDLVKYESYATGELLALRAEKLEVTGMGDRRSGSYVFRVQWHDPVIRPFRQVNWYERFRRAYIHNYGEVDWPAYRLLEAYFGLAMALCTTGLQQQGRLLKATLALNAAGARP